MTPMHWLWLSALALIVLSLAMLLWPLLKESAAVPPHRDETLLRRLYQAQFDELARELHAGNLSAQAHAQAEDELHRRLLAELDSRPVHGGWRHRPWLARTSALVLAVALPLAAFALYLQVGNPQAAARLAQLQEMGHGAADVQVEAMVEGLALRLRKTPQNVPGWVMLGRSYETLERFDAAADAYAQALAAARLDQMDASVQAQLLADMADALGSARGGDLQGAAGAAINEALRLQPDQHKALALAGSAAVRRGDFDQARSHWRTLLAQLEPGSDIALRVQDDLLQLETLGMAQGTPVAPVVDTHRLSGEIRWPAVVQAQALPPQARVFVIVRAPGQAPPVAVLRLPANEWPTRFALGKAQLLDPQAGFADFPVLQIHARLSRSGSTQAEEQDLRSPTLEVKPGAAPLVLEMAGP